jgi:hypothetical protein
MFKISSYDPFEHLKHKLWPNEKSGVKLAVWLPTTKSQELTRFPCVQVACNISLESSWRGLQLCFRPHLNWRSVHKVMRHQSYRSSDFGSSGIKCYLDVGLVERHKVYYKGEGGGFPQVWAVVSLVSPSCLWWVLAPKVF